MGRRIRVWELARDLELNSVDVIARLRDLGVEVSSHAATLDLETAGRVRAAVAEERTGHAPARVRVYEVARSAGLHSKEALEQLAELGIDASTHTSTVWEFDAEKLLEHITSRERSGNGAGAPDSADRQPPTTGGSIATGGEVAPAPSSNGARPGERTEAEEPDGEPDEAPDEGPGETTPPGNGPSFSDLELITKLVLLAKPYWKLLPVVIVTNLIGAPLALLAPVPLAIAIDSVLQDKPLPAFIEPVFPAALTGSDTALLAATAILLIVVSLLSQLQAVASSYVTSYTGERMLLDLRSMLFERCQQLSLGYHDRKGTSDSLYRIQYDTSYIQSVAIDSVAATLTSAATLVGMLYVLLRLDWILVLVSLVVTPPLVYISQGFRTRLRGRYRNVKQLESSAVSIIQEVLTSMPVVKAFAQEAREQDRFVRRSREGMRERLRLELLEGGLGVVLGLITAVGTALFLYVGVRRVQADTLTLGQLTIAITYLSQMYRPLRSLSKQVAAMQGSLASAERAFELLEEEPAVVEREDARPLTRAEGRIEFRDVTFAYDGGTPVLRDVSFAIEPGTRLGIVGRTGAGKSTLLKLLMRFYDPTEGQILLDGVDLRDYALEDLRQQYAVVLQESVLFSTTIGENIAYGRPGARHEEIVAAAEAANVSDTIEDLPEGYDAVVGERGATLSGGERQRVALARAFLKDAPILVLDEPTSSVDLETEREIVEATERLREGRTVLTIAHRLATLDDCDQLLEVSHGRVRSVVRSSAGAAR